MLLKKYFCFLLLACSLAIYAQEESLDEIFKVDYDTPLTLEIKSLQDSLSQTATPQKKKVKKKVFFGLKTRKGFVKTIKGGNAIFETFYILKEPVEPTKYARDFYWFDYKTRKIKNSLRIPKDGKIGVLHGPYKKMLGEQIIEQGWFYKGMKHKRWVAWNRHDILQDKKYWWRGWPQESRLSWWDHSKTQLKEVIPIHYGERDGEYWIFHKDGSIAVRGEFEHDERVGLWREYYDDRRIKREVLYPEKAFAKKNPFIQREWNARGKLTYDIEKSGK